MSRVAGLKWNIYLVFFYVRIIEKAVSFDFFLITTTP